MRFIPYRESFDLSVLDNRLALGYFRAWHLLFTTDTTYDDQSRKVRAIWVRVKLNEYCPGKHYRRLEKKCGAFACTIHDAEISEEAEALYSAYLQHINFFDPPRTVRDCLLGDAQEAYFPTRMFQVRDGERLIAVGYFDEGRESVAAILNFYHPDYKDYRLGIWLYFQAIRYAAETGKRFFYPGYVALGYSKFDYKVLFLDKDAIELWEPETNSWVPYKELWLAQQYLPK